MDEEIQSIGEDHPRQQDDEHGEGCVFELRSLQFHRPELDAPANRCVWRRRFEPHIVPIGRLEILEVVCVACIILINLLLEDDQRISDHQVRDVLQ